MSPEEWKIVDRTLRHNYARVKMACDGYTVDLVVEPIKRLRSGICVYVNGTLEGKWYIDDCEERRRFFSPSKRHFWDTEERRRFSRMSKKTLKMLNIDPSRTFTLYSPVWTSFRRMKAHFEKNNDVIMLVEPETTKEEMTHAS